MEKKKLHKTAHFVAASKEDHIAWSSHSNAIPNEVDIFQAYRLRKRFNLQTITTSKYIFALEGRAKEFKFDIFGTRHFDALVAKGKKKPERPSGI